MIAREVAIRSRPRGLQKPVPEIMANRVRLAREFGKESSHRSHAGAGQWDSNAGFIVSLHRDTDTWCPVSQIDGDPLSDLYAESEFVDSSEAAQHAVAVVVIRGGRPYGGRSPTHAIKPEPSVCEQKMIARAVFRLQPCCATSGEP